jgi:outer membrane protein OmpA-like peptidoglycan-associated protein
MNNHETANCNEFLSDAEIFPSIRNVRGFITFTAEIETLKKIMTRDNVGKVLLSFAFAIVLTGCGSSNEKKDETKENTVESEPAQSEDTPTNATEAFKEFDWNTVPQSSSQIGEFPYLTAPAGYIIVDRGGSNESKTGYSELEDFNKLIIYDGTAFYNAEGKVAKLKFTMLDKDADWNQYKFDSSVDKYLASIGAKLLGKLKLTSEQKAFLNKDDDMAIYNHIVGDPYNDPVRCYALNHEKGKIMFQVFSNSATGDIAVVELEGFEQTIKPPTAAQMKKDIDASGKAIVNINFDTDKSTLRPDGEKVVNEILTMLKESADLKVAIEGHTDNVGTADRNKKLSEERANVILKELTNGGIASGRLTAAGYGAERPLVANDNEANMAKNRRVELVKK